MNTFSIDEAALEKIKHNISLYQYSHPVIVLVDMTEIRKEDDDIKKAILEGKKQDELAAMIRKRYKEKESRLSYYLKPLFYDKKDINPEYYINIDGIVFFMDSFTQKALREYCLSYENGCYLLRREDHVAYRLSDIKGRKAYKM